MSFSLLLLIGFGVAFIVRGIIQYGRWRIIHSTLTSLIRDIQPGLIEVKGKIVPMETVASPLTGLQCVLYQIVVKEDRRFHSLAEEELSAKLLILKKGIRFG